MVSPVKTRIDLFIPRTSIHQLNHCLNAHYPEQLTTTTMLFYLWTQTWHPQGSLPSPKMTHWQLWPSPWWWALVKLHWFGDSQDSEQRATGIRIRSEVWIFPGITYHLWVSERSLSTCHLLHTSAVSPLKLPADDKPLSSGPWKRIALADHLLNVGLCTGVFSELVHSTGAGWAKIFTHACIHSTLVKGHLCPGYWIEININKTHSFLSNDTQR